MRCHRCKNTPAHSCPYLFAHLVNRRSVGLVHLVELIDGADAPVGKDKGATLQRHLPSDGILAHLQPGVGSRVEIDDLWFINA